jgi:LuxR family maltose regulon positive regulatory protein
VYRLPEIAAAQVAVLLRQGNLTAAAELAQRYELPLYQARVHLARGDASAALALLEPLRRHMETKGWVDERLKVMVLQTVALHVHSEEDAALQLLGEVLTLAEPEGFIRTFVDEGAPMAELLERMNTARAGGRMAGYMDRLLAAFGMPKDLQPSSFRLPSLVDPLSERELEILRLIAQGLSNQEIGERLFLALDTIKGHNRRIYDKLQVQRRTEAVARARELGLL